MTEVEFLRRALCRDNLRRALCRDKILLAIPDLYAGILEQIDFFVALSQGNDTIRTVNVRPYDADPGNYERWDKAGQGMANLKSLDVLGIYFKDALGEPDWEILARILPHIQNKIKIRIIGLDMEGTEEMRAFARAIQGRPGVIAGVARRARTHAAARYSLVAKK
jgi:hypothetical protein